MNNEKIQPLTEIEIAITALENIKLTASNALADIHNALTANRDLLSNDQFVASVAAEYHNMNCLSKCGETDHGEQETVRNVLLAIHACCSKPQDPAPITVSETETNPETTQERAVPTVYAGGHTYDLGQMTETDEFAFRGQKYKVVCSHQSHPYHSSLWTHMDETETRDAFWTIEPGDVVFDVGADFGSYTLSSLAAGARAVFAWSPPFKLPTTAIEAETLKMSLIANGWEEKVTLFTSGLWSRPGWMAGFDGPRPAQVYDSKEEAETAIAGQPGHVSIFPVDTLDNTISQYEGSLGSRSWLKIDTEGCELAILKGGVRFILERKPRIMLEHHYHIDEQCEMKCDEFLTGLGYVKKERRQHHTVAHSLYIHQDSQ